MAAICDEPWVAWLPNRSAMPARWKRSRSSRAQMCWQAVATPDGNHDEHDQSGCLTRRVSKVVQPLESGGHTALLGVNRGELAFQNLHPGGLLIAGLLRLLQHFSLSGQFLLEVGVGLENSVFVVGGSIAFVFK